MRFSAASFFQLSHDRLAETVNGARACNRDQRHLAALAGLEAPRRSRCNIEAHATGFGAVELECWSGLEEVIVRADLNRPVAAVRDSERQRFAALVELDVAGLDEIFTGDHLHLIGLE